MRRRLPGQMELATLALLTEAEEAKTDFTKFFEFVIRHETKGTPLEATAHQRLMFSFGEAHPLCVIMIPVGCAKTYYVGAKTLHRLGKDCTKRGVVFSRAQGQAKKVLKMVSDYIEDPKLSQRLHLVFPELRPSSRDKDTWSTESITVNRPAGIRDPSLQAVGIGGEIQGSRLAFALPDDLVTNKNSYTIEGRIDLRTQFDDNIMSRLDPDDYECTVCNTPWHREDQLFYLEEQGWPTLVMDIYGFIRISNAKAEWMARVLDTIIRPSETRVGGAHDWYRLRAFDPDPDEQHVLWEEKYPREKIEEIKRRTAPHAFARSYLCRPMSEDALRCSPDWIEKCKLRGMGSRLVAEYKGPNKTYTGIDLAIGKKKHHDKTTYFTFEKLPDGSRKILDIESGRFDGVTIISKLVDKADRYGSIIWVENNGAQDYLLQFAKEHRKDIAIHSHTTSGANKHDVDFGVESMFVEFQNEAWVIPCGPDGKCHPEVQAFVDDCLFYQPPPAHTGDRLMAAWIGREAARKRGGSRNKAGVGKSRQITHSTGGF